MDARKPMSQRLKKWFAFLLATSVAGCAWPGQPDPKDKFVYPDKVMDFAKLYGKHCAGCHGKDGRLGAAPPLNDSLFRALIPEETLAAVIGKGRPGTSMPGFAQSGGGPLTPAQIS